MDIFERASRKKLRFTTTIGDLSADDLWDLSLDKGRANLDAIAADLHGKIQVPGNFSLVNPDKVSATQADNELRFEIVKHIVGVKMAKADAAKAAAARRAERDTLLAAAARKQGEVVDSMDLDAIRKRMAELDAEEDAGAVEA